MASVVSESGATRSENAPKNARLELRSTLTQKTIIERAASLTGESVTSFVLSTALRDAVKVIKDYRVTELSLDDWARFNSILAADVEPNTELSDALQKYQKRILSSDGE